MEESTILDTSVTITGKRGAVTIFTVIEYPPSLDGVTDLLFPDMIDYTLATDMARKLRSVGKTVGTIDILIATMCLRRGLILMTKDQDHKTIQSVYPDLKLTS